MTAGVKALVACLLLAAVAALVARGTSHDPYVVRAEFEDAAGLRTNSLVEVGGQPVGHVRELELSPADTAKVEMVIDDAGVRIGAGASAAVRPANILGEKYVDLRPGRRTTPVPSGSEIPTKRTGAPVELDDVLDVLDVPTRVALAMFINESGKALTGRGEDFARLLAALPSSLDETTTLIRDLGTDTGALGSLVEESDRVVARIASERVPLGELVGNASRVLGATASRSSELAATIRSAPGALRQLQSTLGELDRTARPLGTAADDLRAAAPALTGLLKQIRPFAQAARPTLRTATEVAPTLAVLGRRTAPVLHGLRRITPDLTRFSQVLSSFSRGFEEGAPNTLGAAEGWARAIQVRDNAGHLFRNDVGFTSDTVRSLARALVNQVPSTRRGDRRRRPARQSAPSQSPHEPSQPTRPALKLPELSLPGLDLPVPEVQLPGLLEPGDDASVDSGVRDLLDYLLK